MNPNSLVTSIRDIYQSNDFIPLHAPTFGGNEKNYLAETIDSTFVSSVGAFVDQFERQVETFTRSHKAIATVNGTAALHAALFAVGVKNHDLVITQALTFVATCNAIFHIGAEPVFLDVERASLGLSPAALDAYLTEFADVSNEGPVHKKTGQKIAAVVPMHTFGLPLQIEAIAAICQRWNLPLIEDAAEALGTYYQDRHVGTFGDIGALSFNGNKIITTGGGGMLLSQHAEQARHLKHITTTAKVPHPYEFYHDEPAFNYRLPNLNAALGCAQMEQLTGFLHKKRALAERYEQLFKNTDLEFVKEPAYGRSNYWLNAVLCSDKNTRDEYLRLTNEQKVMTRPVWQLMNTLPMFQHCFCDDLTISKEVADRLVNLPSTPV